MNDLLDASQAYADNPTWENLIFLNVEANLALTTGDPRAEWALAFVDAEFDRLVTW
jgi:hypothetical protein